MTIWPGCHSEGNLLNNRTMAKGNYYIYITTNPSKTVLYTGVTNTLERRLLEHYTSRGNKNNFAGKYYCYKLLYYEYFENINQAITREKEIKDMSRKRKEELIKTLNPKMNFLVVNGL